MFLTLLLPTATGWGAPIDAGELGESSQVKIELSLNVLPTIQISNVEDITLSITDRSIDASFSEDLCIKGNSGDSYTLTVTGTTNSGSGYSLGNDQGERLFFDVLYQAEGSASELPMMPDQSSPYFDLPALNTDCAGKLSSLSVLFKSSELLKVSPGLYTGELTLVVSPI